MPAVVQSAPPDALRISENSKELALVSVAYMFNIRTWLLATVPNAPPLTVTLKLLCCAPPMPTPVVVTRNSSNPPAAIPTVLAAGRYMPLVGTVALLGMSDVPVTVPLLTTAATVAVPAELKLPPYSAPVNVPVVPLTAPLLVKLETVAAPAMLTAPRKLAIPPTSTVLRGSTTPRPISPLESIRIRSV